ncbi:MAG TPA: DUF3343 domain-containing protein [Bacteroidales bacterium]|nr:DUF3343 domain-containing protein [Bacteroidales bacterium]
MNENSGKCLLLFQSIHRVMQAERIISSLGISYQIVPVPKEFSSECGMCIEVLCSSNNILVAELQRNNIFFNKVKVHI